MVTGAPVVAVRVGLGRGNDPTVAEGVREGRTTGTVLVYVAEATIRVGEGIMVLEGIRVGMTTGSWVTRLQLVTARTRTSDTRARIFIFIEHSPIRTGGCTNANQALSHPDMGTLEVTIWFPSIHTPSAKSDG
jgi:hypothetical protein